ncbi:hypothetical protein AB1E18_010392 [Capra hircus]
MPMSSLPAAILSHMIAVSNVPPPPLRSIPNLQKSKNIDYGELNALCHMRGKQHSRTNILSAHNVFMKQYPKIFVQKKVRLPKLFKEEEKRIPAEVTEESKPPQPDDSHNIAIHVKKARGGRTLYGPKKYEETVVQFMAILKKLPIHRTPFEHNIVWKMLKTIPDLTSQLLDEHLKILSKNVISETWIKGSTVIGNDGFYIILKGLARPQTQIYKNLIEEHDSTTSFIPQSFHSFVFSEDIRNPLLTGVGHTLGQWSTFGTLEVAAHIEPETKEYSVVTEEDCEILKIPANNYAKLKTEKTKLENQHKVKLIHKCPYYVEWPTLSIYELVTFTKWKKFPPGHVIVESGNIISFVAYINSGYCKIYRNIIGFTKLQSRKVKKIQKHVYMGRLNEKESFGEISVLLQVPFTCTIVTGEDVEMAIIEDKDLHVYYCCIFHSLCFLVILPFKMAPECSAAVLFGASHVQEGALDPVTKQLMLQTAKPTFGHLSDEDVKKEYLQKEQKREWKSFKDTTVKNSLYHNGIIPGFGKWDHSYCSIRIYLYNIREMNLSRNNKDEAVYSNIRPSSRRRTNLYDEPRNGRHLTSTHERPKLLLSNRDKAQTGDARSAYVEQKTLSMSLTLPRRLLQSCTEEVQHSHKTICTATSLQWASDSFTSEAKPTPKFPTTVSAMCLLL